MCMWSEIVYRYINRTNKKHFISEVQYHKLYYLRAIALKYAYNVNKNFKMFSPAFLTNELFINS